jgi:hypothetical protein
METQPTLEKAQRQRQRDATVLLAGAIEGLY